jgi:hypothetical protein
MRSEEEHYLDEKYFISKRKTNDGEEWILCRNGLTFAWILHRWKDKPSIEEAMATVAILKLGA